MKFIVLNDGKEFAINPNHIRKIMPVPGEDKCNIYYSDGGTGRIDLPFKILIESLNKD